MPAIREALAAVARRRLPAVHERGSWLLSAAVALMVLVAAGSLGPLLVDGQWWWACCFVVMLVVFVPAALRAVRVPRFWASVSGVLVLVFTITLIFAPATTFWLLPTADTLHAFIDLVEEGTASIYRQSIPATAPPGILFLIVGSVGLLAVLVDLIVFEIRVPAFTGLLIIPVLATSGVVQGNRVDILAFALTAASFFLLLRADMLRRPATRPNRRSTAVHARRPRGAWAATAGVAAMSIVGALLVAAAVPGYDRGPLAPVSRGATIFSGAINPVISLGNDLRRPNSTQALVYRTTGEQAQYLSVVTLDRFTGDNWAPTLRDPDPSHTVNSIVGVPGLADDVDVTRVQTDIAITNVSSRWLPIPYPSVKVQVTGTWYWNPTDLSVSGDEPTRSGLRYTTGSLVLHPTLAQLESAPVPQDMEKYTELPDDLPAIISDTARSATESTTSRYAQAVELQKYLRSSAFSYSVDAPVEQDYDGDGMHVIAKFLEVKTGYCIHFSSAMAVMARSLGIPARLSVGYQPGTEVSESGGQEKTYEVSSSDLHSWPELYFDGIGWLPFEPTPGRGAAPDYSLPAALTPSTATDDPSAAPSPGTTATPSAAPLRPVDSLDDGVVPTETTSPSPWPPFLIAVGILLVLLLPAFGRRVQRQLRLRRYSGSNIERSDVAANAWREILATAKDLGIGVSETQTPREMAAALTGLPGMGEHETSALNRICDNVESEWFADPRDKRPLLVKPHSEEIRSILSGLVASVGPAARIRALLLPYSLVSQQP